MELTLGSSESNTINKSTTKLLHIMQMQLLDYLPTVADFPKPGIQFRDISPLLGNPAAFAEAIGHMAAIAQQFDYSHIVGVDSRGFVFASALALHAQKSLVLVRKPNKLPQASHRESYGLEYGSDALEIQSTSLPPGSRVLLIDDVLATGGTLIAAAKLINQVGAVAIASICLLEIESLGGKAKLGSNGLVSRAVLKTA
jgi:adenine phosphoribosyltransferase